MNKNILLCVVMVTDIAVYAMDQKPSPQPDRYAIAAATCGRIVMHYYAPSVDKKNIKFKIPFYGKYVFSDENSRRYKVWYSDMKYAAGNNVIDTVFMELFVRPNRDSYEKLCDQGNFIATNFLLSSTKKSIEKSPVGSYIDAGTEKLSKMEDCFIKRLPKNLQDHVKIGGIWTGLVIEKVGEIGAAHCIRDILNTNTNDNAGSVLGLHIGGQLVGEYSKARPDGYIKTICEAAQMVTAYNTALALVGPNHNNKTGLAACATTNILCRAVKGTAPNIWFNNTIKKTFGQHHMAVLQCLHFIMRMAANIVFYKAFRQCIRNIALK